MSYRTLKRMLGETNFELKSLLLFGFGLTLLAVGTFLLYWWQTSHLVDDQNRRTAQLLAQSYLLQIHWERAEQEFFKPMIKRMALEFKPEDLRDVTFELWDANPASADSKKRPTDGMGYEAMESLQQLYRERQSEIERLESKTKNSEPQEEIESSKPQGESESSALGKMAEQRQAEINRLRQKEIGVIRVIPEKDEYQYYRASLAQTSCLQCHYHMKRYTADGKLVNVKKGELIGFVKTTVPLERMEEALHQAFAFVISAEVVKVVLGIFAIYLVVRYVITKPVLHLKKVSDAIAHGNLDMRADIRTGDEFEELSHAFNRMLRHLVTVQEELREVNTDLDGKVDELAQANFRLHQLNSLKNEFLATMSHELRTPLNSILGFSDVLSHAEGLTEKQNRYVANIRVSGTQLMALINDVLDLAKIESGKMETNPVEFSISDVVERQVGAMVPMVEAKNIELTWAVDSAVPILFQDVGKVRQLLNNLLSNAVKFTPEGGRVRVCAGLFDEKTLEMIVEDTGIGIPLEDQDTIFEKFRQGKAVPGLQNTLTRQYEGTGLGLSIVKELSKLLGGEVLVSSEFGKGSAFTVRIPTHLDTADHARSLVPSPATVGVNRLKPKDVGLTQ